MQGLIAFDLDGVLYSAAPFLGEAYREAIARVNRRRPGAFPRVPAAREILDLVGWPVSVILDRLFPGVDRAAVDLLSVETLEVVCAYVARGEGVVFPGVPETLAELRRSGWRLSVASNGRRRYVETVLAANGLTPYFVELVSVDGSGMIGSKADVLRAYLAHCEIPVDRLILVGDRASDVEAATAVGCRFVGCDYGHGHRAEIEAAGPVVSRFAQLPAVIAAMVAPPLPNLQPDG